jgi:hypothetical protein
MRRGLAISLVVALLGALGGCGGGGGLSAEDKQWIAAAAAGFDASQVPGITTAQRTCLAKALVTKITVKRLKAVGVTLAQMRDPNNKLPKQLAASVPSDTRTALGRAAQACDFGKIFGRTFAQSSGEANAKPAEISCVEDGFDASNAQMFIGDLALTGDTIPKVDAQFLSRLLIKCLDFAPLFAKQFNVTFSPTEAACVTRTLRGDPAWATALAGRFAGSSDPSSFASAGKALVPCLTPAHLAQIGQASK